jgi:hypothetical protein
MTTAILPQTALILVLTAGFAFAQPAPNAPRTVEISYTGNLPFFLGLGFVRKKGWNLGGACVQVAVKVTDSAAMVGEFCGTHQFVEGANPSKPLRRRLVLSEPRDWQQVDSLHSVRGGVRFTKLAGDHITTFVQALAGVESGYRQGGFAGNNGFSFAGGGGVDVNVTNWFGYEIARVNYQTTRVARSTVNSLRFGTGPVFRMGEVSDESNGSEESSQQP